MGDHATETTTGQNEAQTLRPPTLVPTEEAVLTLAAGHHCAQFHAQGVRRHAYLLLPGLFATSPCAICAYAQLPFSIWCRDHFSSAHPHDAHGEVGWRLRAGAHPACGGNG
eukprot:2787210-Pleurochrysis_carterae.AAC.1